MRIKYPHDAEHLPVKRFGDMPSGTVFKTHSHGSTFMKTKDGFRNHNAVRLGDGTPLKFKEDDVVLFINKAVLLLEGEK